MSNPFLCGNPVPVKFFVNREREIQRIKNRIITQGQSSAIIGEPRSGKTSLLDYLAAPEKKQELYGQLGDYLLFSYLNAQTLGGTFTQAQFWEYVLSPLYEKVASSDSPLNQAYEISRDNGFGNFVMERLLAQIAQTNWRLVLMLDEFDALLYHPILNSAEFFGGLRTLASRSRGVLSVIIASRQALNELNKATQKFSRAGSPYFNFLSEIILEPFSEKAAAELLGLAGNRFSANDRRFIVNIAGGHPYLLQTAASILWETYEDNEDDPIQRWQATGESVYDQVALTLGDTWQLWSPATRRGFTAIALPQIMLEQHQFYEERLLANIRDFGPELRLLKKQGFITQSTTGWQIRPRAFLWWLADELVRTVRDEPSYEEWLRKQEWDGLLTRGEREQLGKVVHTVVDMLKDGAVKLVEAAAKGAGKAIVKTE